MVRSRIKASPVESEFPKLMIADDGEVVLFTDSAAGTVLVSGDNLEGDANPVGFHMRSWNIDFFKDFTGTVALSNEG